MIVNQIFLCKGDVPSKVLDLSKNNKKKAKKQGCDYILWTKKNLYPSISHEDRQRLDSIKIFPAAADFARILVLDLNEGLYIDLDNWIDIKLDYRKKNVISVLQNGNGFITNAILKLPRDAIDLYLSKARKVIDERRHGDARIIGAIPLRQTIRELKFEFEVIGMPDGCENLPKAWDSTGRSTWVGWMNIFDHPKTMKEELS